MSTRWQIARLRLCICVVGPSWPRWDFASRGRSKWQRAQRPIELEVELVEHKLGRYIDEIQFAIRPKRQAALPIAAGRGPVDLSLIESARKLGIREEVAESMLEQHGDEALRAALSAVEKRAASEFPNPLRSAERYLKAIIPNVTVADSAASDAVAAPAQANRQAVGSAGPGPEAASKRQSAWIAQWRRRRREALAAEIDAPSAQTQAELMTALADDLHERDIHPTVLNRLQSSGWKHPMVLPEMVASYAKRTSGDGWDELSPRELLAIAAEGIAGPELAR